MALRPMAIKPVLTGALDVRHEQVSLPHVGQWVRHEIEHAWSVNAVFRNSCRLTGNAEVIPRDPSTVTSCLPTNQDLPECWLLDLRQHYPYDRCLRGILLRLLDLPASNEEPEH